MNKDPGLSHRTPIEYIRAGVAALVLSVTRDDDPTINQLDPYLGARTGSPDDTPSELVIPKSAAEIVREAGFSNNRSGRRAAARLLRQK